jgi:N-acetylmuramoyl-L-alanine amidase
MIGSSGVINSETIYGTKFKPMILKKRHNYSKYIEIKPEYITNHDTRNFNADAKEHAEYLENLFDEHKSWHFTVDDKMIIQHMPIIYNGWHCGDGSDKKSGNMTSIGIEGCVFKGIDLKMVRLNMIKLNVYLMNNVKWLLGDNWIKTIVQHHKWMDKDCPYFIRHSKGGFSKFQYDCMDYNQKLKERR